MPQKMKTRIKVIDVLPKIAFKDLQEYCQTDKFEIVSYGEKEVLGYNYSKCVFTISKTRRV
jgi:hypothetical protein